jgi:hypothetical protein
MSKLSREECRKHELFYIELARLIATGMLEVVGHDEKGCKFSLTERGRARAEQLVREDAR